MRLTRLQSSLGYDTHDQPDPLQLLNHQAGQFESWGAYDRALPLYEELLSQRKRALGPDHPDTIASLNNVALLLFRKGDMQRALPLCEDVLKSRQRVLGEEDPDTFVSLNNLALLLSRMGDMSRALPLYEQCFALRSRVLGEDHPDTLVSQDNLALSFIRQGQSERALALYVGSLNSPPSLCYNIYSGMKRYLRSAVVFSEMTTLTHLYHWIISLCCCFAWAPTIALYRYMSNDLSNAGASWAMITLQRCSR